MLAVIKGDDSCVGCHEGQRQLCHLSYRVVTPVLVVIMGGDSCVGHHTAR